MFRVALQSLFAVALLVPSHGALAQSYDGTWRGGPVRMQVNVESWGRDCGPQPRSHTGEATGSVRISQDGDHLVLHGTPERRTDRCWSENRMVRRVSSTHDTASGRWRVVCRTRPNDPRAETGTYTLTARDESRLSYREVSNYDWQLNESRCKATMTVTQSFNRTGAGATTPTPEEPRPEARCTPGDPARIRLRPSEAEVEPGGQVRFSGRVVDATGCPVRRGNVRWSLNEPEGASGTLDDGLFTAAENAAEAEGEFTVVARSGALRADARVVVRTADLSDLIARRATVGVTQTVDEDFEITAESAAGVSARAEEPEEEESSILPFILGAVVALVLLIGVVVIVVARKGGKAAPAPVATATVDDELAAAAPARVADPPLDSDRRLAVPRSCPVCHVEFDDPGVTFCPEDGATLVSRSEPPSGQALICPTCRRGFGGGKATCPTDGDELIPYALFVSQHRDADATGGKICPTCGEKYGRQVTFCGKDGAALVVVN